MKMFIINIYGIAFFNTKMDEIIVSLLSLKRAITQLILNLREIEFVITLVMLFNY